MQSGAETVVLTGCGWVTPFAAGTIDEVLAAAGRGRAPAASEDVYWAVPDEMIADYPDLSAELKREKGGWITAAALIHARADASLREEDVDADRVGMVLGCALAGQLGMIDFATEVREQTARFVSPIHFPQTVGNYLAGALARSYGIRGPNATIACGAASGLDAIVEACGIVANGKANVVFAGGADTLSKELAGGLAEPGVRLSEGACLFVLESAAHAASRDAKALASIIRHSHDHQRSDDTTAGQEGALLISGTSCRQPGAIVIEHWVGRCPGALGAACMAAAVGAVRGSVVPVRDRADQDAVLAAQIPLDELRTDDGTVLAVVFADNDQTHRTSVELAIFSGGQS